MDTNMVGGCEWAGLHTCRAAACVHTPRAAVPAQSASGRFLLQRQPGRRVQPHHMRQPLEAGYLRGGGLVGGGGGRAAAAWPLGGGGRLGLGLGGGGRLGLGLGGSGPSFAALLPASCLGGGARAYALQGTLAR
jgi:hypothetical protein